MNLRVTPVRPTGVTCVRRVTAVGLPARQADPAFVDVRGVGRCALRPGRRGADAADLGGAGGAHQHRALPPALESAAGRLQVGTGSDTARHVCTYTKKYDQKYPIGSELEHVKNVVVVHMIGRQIPLMTSQIIHICTNDYSDVKTMVFI